MVDNFEIATAAVDRNNKGDALLGKAADGNLPSFLLVTLITLVLIALTLFILSKTFMSLARKNNVAAKKVEKASAPQEQTPPKKALLRREFAHFTATPIWMLNGGFGLLLLPIGAVVLLLKSGTIREFLPEFSAEIPELYALLPVLFPAAVCLILSVNAISPVSISMEGK